MLSSFLLLLETGKAQDNQDAIVGKWMNEDKDLVVDVYKENNNFKAKIIWFHDAGDTITPIDQRLDIKNPDKILRSRKVLGMEVLSNLVYDPEENKWMKGKIYDSTSGRTWDASVWLSDPQTLQVRGYYIFKFIGKTMKFTKVL
ncbi:MAG: DUF2147 domain-containing protein [Bacteroidota bacterium]|nr:DUF2147 domain-containing protein [Bacteroidota bacterium]